MSTGRIIKPDLTRFPEPNRKAIELIGHIKIGEVPQGKSYPVSLDHFKATGAYAGMFHNAYGVNPRKIEIAFASNENTESCYERYEIWQGKKLFAYGDGENFKVYNPKTDQYEDKSTSSTPDLMQKVEDFLNHKDHKWKHILSLYFIVLGIPGLYGAWELSTSGHASSIPKILKTFDETKEATKCPNFPDGFVSGIPFDLLVEKVTSNKPGSQSKFPVLTLVRNMSQEMIETYASFLQAGRKVDGFLLTEDKIKGLLAEPKNMEVEHDN